MHTIIVHIFKYTISSTGHALKTVHLKMYTQNRTLEDVYSKMHTEKCILKNA